MKKHCLIMLISILVLSVLLAGCGNDANTNTVSDSGQNAEAAQTDGKNTDNTASAVMNNGETMGRVTAVDGNTITVELFSQQTMPGGNQGSMPDMSGSGQGSMPDMSAGSQGSMPDMPGGSQGGMPDMSAGSQGSMPDMSGGSQGSLPDMSGGGQGSMPDMSGGSQGNMPDMPGGTQGSMPDMSGGSQGSMPDMSGGGRNGGPGQTGESKTITISDTSILFMLENNNEVQAELSDISVGSMLKITYGESGNLEKIVISTVSNIGGGME